MSCLTFAGLNELRHSDDRGRPLRPMFPNVPPRTSNHSPEILARAEALAAEWGCPVDAMILDAARLPVEAERA